MNVRTVPASVRPCEAHRYHRPEPTFLELHHIICQSWQLYLWQRIRDPRVVALCRTGHGNVHWAIERLMRQQEIAPVRRRSVEHRWAREALRRVEAMEPGAVERLRAAKHWGGMAGT